MDLSDLYHWYEAAADRLNSIVDQNGFVLFFVKNKDVYGATEDSRVVFAKLKNPEKDLPSGWTDQANFSAYNLSSIIKGENGNCLFSKDDLKEIQVIDREKALEKLQVSTKDNKTLPTVVKIASTEDPDKAPNFIQTSEV